MIIEKNKVVSVSYELRIQGKEGEVVDLAYEESPLQFIYGIGMMLPKFEEYLSNLKVNDTFDFMLTSEEGYGKRNEENVSDVPKNIFEQNGVIQDGLLDVGNVIPLQDQEGNHFNAQVVSVIDDIVKLDFNHPLADEDLYFTGTVLEIREASEHELSHGHVHHHGHDHHDH